MKLRTLVYPLVAVAVLGAAGAADTRWCLKATPN